MRCSGLAVGSHPAGLGSEAPEQFGSHSLDQEAPAVPSSLGWVAKPGTQHYSDRQAKVAAPADPRPTPLALQDPAVGSPSRVSSAGTPLENPAAAATLAAAERYTPPAHEQAKTSA